MEFTLAYDAVFNEAGLPRLKKITKAVYSGNVKTWVMEQGQTGIQSTLDSVKS